MGLEPNVTQAHGAGRPSLPVTVRRFRLTVVEGPCRGQSWASAGATAQLGSHEANDLVLTDPTVSRFHCEIRLHEDAAHVHDLGSTNGTILDGVSVVDGLLRGDSRVRLGASVVRFAFAAEQNQVPVSEHRRFGTLTGESAALRATFASLERAAASTATVLLEGETGTGKSQAALSLHRGSVRRAGPFVTVDCGAIPANLLESELFGHERGAFTGAVQRRIGSFEAASGGTLFLDELGELPTELQPKLLRALEAREVRRVGANSYRPVDVRVVAATNRDLRAEVAAGRFREDLYFRLAVIPIRLPPLRERPEDILPLARHFLARWSAELGRRFAGWTPEVEAWLLGHGWPGNVRELENLVERAAVLARDDRISLEDLLIEASPAVGEAAADGPELTLQAHLDRAAERRIRGALARCEGRRAEAARSLGVERTTLYRLMKKFGIDGEGPA